ncbi:MAG: L,D-transpeptidase [Candidatus Kapabacteria bacterium]|nr:L,D-transpeptidase [Candidatus Kapabacteria bacterium]
MRIRLPLVLRLPHIVAATAVMMLHACADPNAEAVRQQEAIDSVAAAKAQLEHMRRVDSITNRFPRIDYVRTVIRDVAMRDSIRATFGAADSTWTAYRAFTAVNRKDIQFFRVGDTIMLPSTLEKDLRAYSVFPQWYEGGRDVEKIIFISNKWQSYACYSYGELVRFAAANTGEEGKPTFPGRYAVNWKSRFRISSLDSTWKLPFTVNFHQYAGSAFHQFEMPGRPVSHSCVRQFLSDAEWLFKWVRQGKRDTNGRPIKFTGTPVIILDMFDYGRRRGGPWWDVTSNKDVLIALPNKPLDVEEALIPISQIPKEVRGALPNASRYRQAEAILRERGVIRDSARLKESVDWNKVRAERRRKKAAEAARKAAQQDSVGG